VRAGATCMLAWALAGCTTVPLGEAVEASEAHDMVAVLAAHGLRAEARSARGGRAQVEVASDRRHAAWTVLHRYGLPRRRAEPDARPLIAGPAEAARRDRAAAGDRLARLLEARPDVFTARVALAPRSAAVVVRAAQGAAPTAASVTALIRTGAGLGPQDAVAVEIHPWPAAEPLPPSGARPLGWVAAVALVASLASALLVLRARRARLAT
jgi:type III secretory pathway lipoprotein EscJ